MEIKNHQKDKIVKYLLWAIPFTILFFVSIDSSLIPSDDWSSKVLILSFFIALIPWGITIYKRAKNIDNLPDPTVIFATILFGMPIYWLLSHQVIKYGAASVYTYLVGNEFSRELVVHKADTFSRYHCDQHLTNEEIDLMYNRLCISDKKFDSLRKEVLIRISGKRTYFGDWVSSYEILKN